MYYYAQINKDGVCEGVSQLTTLVENENMIQVDSYDVTLLGKLWDNGVWEDVPAPEPVPIETIDEKLARLEQDNLILMDALATLYEELLTLKDGGAV